MKHLIAKALLMGTLAVSMAGAASASAFTSATDGKSCCPKCSCCTPTKCCAKCTGTTCAPCCPSCPKK